MRLVDGGCWKLEWDSSAEESLSGRLFVRNDEERSDAGVWDVTRAGGSSMIYDTENEAGDVVEQSFAFTV